MLENMDQEKSNRKIASFGNSLGVTLPASFVKALNLKKGDSVSVTVNDDNTLTISPNAQPIPLSKIDALFDSAVAKYGEAMNILAEGDK